MSEKKSKTSSTSDTITANYTIKHDGNYPLEIVPDENGLTIQRSQDSDNWIYIHEEELKDFLDVLSRIYG